MSDESENGSSFEPEMEVTEENEKLVLKPKEIIPVNNVDGLKGKLEAIKLNLDWIEKLDITTGTDDEKNEGENSGANDMLEDKAEHDFKREMAFINQAKSAAAEAISRLKKLGVPIKRPDDYFAEMAKPDVLMTKVRQKLLSKEAALERSEKAKALREQRKNAKQIQREVLQKKQSEKKVLMDALKKSKKGKFDVSEILEEQKNQQKGKMQNWNQDKKKGGGKKKKNRVSKEQYKNERYGYGGRKKGSKHNDADSAAYLPGMNKKKSFGGGKFQGKRPNQNFNRPRAKSTRRRR